MIKLHDTGVFLANGAPDSAASLSPEEGRQKTMAWSILQAHNISGNPEHLQMASRRCLWTSATAST